MRPGKGGEGELSRVGVARRKIFAGAFFHRFGEFGEVRKIEAGFDAGGFQVQRQHREIEVAGAFAAAEERPLHAGRPRHQREFSGGHGTAAVVVGVDADRGLSGVAEVADEGFHHIRILVRRPPFDGGGQIEHEIRRSAGAPRGLDAVRELQTPRERRIGEFLHRKFQPDPVVEPGFAQ